MHGMHEVASSSLAGSTENILEEWQNGYCAVLEKPWGSPLAGSSPASSARHMFTFGKRKKQGSSAKRMGKEVKDWEEG